MRPLVERLEQRQFLTTVPSGFVDTTVITGLDEPTAMVQAPDGRIFVAEQDGTIRIIKNNVLLPTPFATMPSINSQNERGLLGIALHPDFETNGWVYTYFTSTVGGVHNHVLRWTADGDVAAPGSDQLIIDLDGVAGANAHMGGAIHFGADGKLYIATGDATVGANSQSLTSTHGKILRINDDGTIPNDNPFFGSTTGVYQSIYAIGFRNPFTFAVQPGTGRIFVNDVGESTFEEINDLEAGANYGWPDSEGPTADVGVTSPVFWYGRATGQVIAGGVFYNPDTADLGADFVGQYAYADSGSGIIRFIDPDNGFAETPFATGGSQIVDLDVTPEGYLLYLERGNGGRIGLIRTFTPPPPDANAPVVTIRQPTGAKPYVAGKKLVFAGKAFDVEDKNIKKFAFNWSVDFVDSNDNVTNLITRSGVKRGAVKLPNNANNDIGGVYRVTLSVSDSTGNVTTVTRDVSPKVITITLTSNVPGARYTLDGVDQPDLTPFQTVAGIVHTYSPIAPDATATETYVFRNWGGGNRKTTRTLAIKRDKTIKMNFSIIPIAPLVLEDDPFKSPGLVG